MTSSSTPAGAPLDAGVSARMSRMPRKDTKPEVALRRELHRRGMRFRLHAKLPGRPDIVFTRARLAIFVDGCFWHACPIHATVPKNNRDWWRVKLEGNVSRDRAKDAQLEALGWVVVHVWEHEPADVAADRIEGLWTLLRAAPRVAGRLSEACGNLVPVAHAASLVGGGLEVQS